MRRRFYELAGLLLVALCVMSTASRAADDWFDFSPPRDRFTDDSAFDLRSLNEKVAGEHGRVTSRGDQFILGSTGKPVRFWAVNGLPKDQIKTYDDAKRLGRELAKRGVNLVRLHGAVFDSKTGEVDPKAIERISQSIDALRESGIYTHISFYFPLWLKPQPDSLILKGYNGEQPPFAALYFNPDFQQQYRGWLRAILSYESSRTDRTIASEPAVFGIELINEDSFFFWTFNDKAVPDAQLQIVERMFGDWLIKKYGSLDKASDTWKGVKEPRDNFAEKRVAFRHLWAVANQRTKRDQDAVRFLAELQRDFYSDTQAFARSLGYAGLVTASNWTTADARYLTPVEKWTYGTTDFIDRHGYIDCNLKGDNSAWSIRDRQTYRDRSVLRFDPEEPGKPLAFNNPVNDPQWAGKPSMISETTICRPNRYRTEAPLFYAAYGALQDTDAIVHFALDGDTWSVKPNFFMQPWTLMSPTQLGQFPAAALIYRQGLVDTGGTVVDLKVAVDDLLDLKGIALAQKAALDQLRKTDVSAAREDDKSMIDPLVYYVGRTKIDFVKDRASKSTISDVSQYVDRDRQTVTSTNGQIKLDWSRGLLTIDSPNAQAVCGDLSKSIVQLSGMTVQSDLDLGQAILVPLDGKPLKESSKMLLQVMSEERATGFRTDPAGDGQQRIVSIGKNPWQVRQLEGTVSLLLPNASALRVTALDGNGYPIRKIAAADTIKLAPDVLYYLISK